MLLEQLKIFAAVAEHLSMTRAAQALHLSQPAVSKHLKHLEESYKLKLHKKAAGGVELTDAGSLFLQHVTPILRQVELLKKRFPPHWKTPARAKNPVLRIGGGRSQSAVLLPTLLSVYRRTHGTVKIDLHSSSTEQVERWLEKGHVEIGILNRRSRSHSLASEPVREDRLVAFVRPQHPLAKKPALTLADVNRFSFVIGGGSPGRSFSEKSIRSLQNAEFSPRISVCCESIEAIKTTVKQRNEIGILYSDCLTAELRRREFVAIHPPGFDFKGRSYLVFPARGELSEEAAAFVEMVRKWRNKFRPPPGERPEE